jgi:hypothetical protein
MIVMAHSANMHTLEPPNKGHSGTNSHVLCREAVPLSEVSKCIELLLLGSTVL